MVTSDPSNPDPTNPWWIPGWTVQNPGPPPPFTPPPEQPFPADIPMITILATYLNGDDEDNPVQGSILVRPNATYTDVASGATILPKVKRYGIVNGQLNIQLPASDSPALEASFTYTVREAIPNGRMFAIKVPSAAGNTPQKLHSLIVDSPVVPIESMPPVYGWQSPAVE
jgi:hypothetical protein